MVSRVSSCLSPSLSPEGASPGDLVCMSAPSPVCLGCGDGRQDGTRGLDGSPATGQNREQRRPDFPATSPSPPSLLLAPLTQLLPSSFFIFLLCPVDRTSGHRGAPTLLVPASASPQGPAESWAPEALAGAEPAKNFSAQNRLCVGMKTILPSPLLPTLSVKPLRSFPSPHGSCSALVFL